MVPLYPTKFRRGSTKNILGKLGLHWNKKNKFYKNFLNLSLIAGLLLKIVSFEVSVFNERERIWNSVVPIKKKVHPYKGVSIMEWDPNEKLLVSTLCLEEKNVVKKNN